MRVRRRQRPPPKRTAVEHDVALSKPLRTLTDGSMFGLHAEGSWMSQKVHEVLRFHPRRVRQIELVASLVARMKRYEVLASKKTRIFSIDSVDELCRRLLTQRHGLIDRRVSMLWLVAVAILALHAGHCHIEHVTSLTVRSNQVELVVNKFLRARTMCLGYLVRDGNQVAATHLL